MRMKSIMYLSRESQLMKLLPVKSYIYVGKFTFLNVIRAVNRNTVSHRVIQNLQLPRCDALSMVGHSAAGHLTPTEGSLELPPLDLVLRLQQAHARLAGGLISSHLLDVLQTKHHVFGLFGVLVHLLFIDGPPQAIYQHTTLHVDVHLLIVGLKGQLHVLCGSVQVASHHLTVEHRVQQLLRLLKADSTVHQKYYKLITQRYQSFKCSIVG